MKRLFPFLLICVLTGTLSAQTLTQRMNALLNDDLLRTSEVGITVFDLTTGQSLFRHQDEKLYRPASVLKVLTSVAALDRLGEDYTFDTRLLYTGHVENDTLHGSLYVAGGMDPELMDADLDRLADAVAALGIRHVTDTIAADVSFMDSVYWGPGWSWDDAPASFQPYLSPLMLNRGCVDVSVTPTQADSLPEVTCVPRSDFYTLVNRAVSRQPQAGKLRITRNWMSHGNQISVEGNVARSSTESLSMYPSEAFFFRTFLNRLTERGITCAATAYADSPAHASVFHTQRRPLGQVLERALKKSDNLCAEALFYHLAARHTGRPRATAADGSEAIGTFLQNALGHDPERCRIADGSGVSLYNYVSPRQLLACLTYAHAHRAIFLPFYESLPVSGTDGTLQHRMKQPDLRGRVHAKTGSVTGVSSLAGYVKADNGHLIAFVIINQNVLKLSRARAFQDKVCALLVHPE